MIRLLVIVVTFLFVRSLNEAAGLLHAQSRIIETKHNLSVTGPGTIKAIAERDVCVFCHTPHTPRESTQLWNKQRTVATYTLYSSDYLTSLNYSAPSQPNPRSKLCLSCHDGTVAVGAVYTMPGGQRGTIQMQGGITTLPITSPGYIGTVLTDDHPVGYLYDPTRDPELVARSWPWNTPIKLDPDAHNGTVECHTCHDPHNDQYGKFLRISNTNAATCTFCHNKTNWTGSIHQSSVQSYTPVGGSTTTVGEWSCRSCHKSHGGAGTPYLQRMSEEQTCFSSGCHGSALTGVNTKNLQSVFRKRYRHPTPDVSGKHKNPDDAASVNVPNRHAECSDCHNAHQAQKGLHTIGTNTVSNVLKGAWGVAPGSASTWTQPTTYTVMKPATQENQICMKCHSSYAFGQVPNGVTTIVGPSGVNITDQAMEFNPANRSAHPVQVPLQDQIGSVAPRALTFSQMSTVWKSTGRQTMYCSDCHGNDQPTSSTVPQGPHGSNNRSMLTGNAKYWPQNMSGELWSLYDVRKNLNNWSNDLFCVNCHPIARGGTFFNNVHEAAAHQTPDVKCVTCHVTVPHGSKRSRLIGYETDVKPYNYSGTGTFDRLVIAGFKKAAGPFFYNVNNCSMNGVCHGTQFDDYEP